MNEFLVLYRVPVSVIEEWMKRDPEERKEAEEKMEGEWDEWMRRHGKTIKKTAGAGKTKRVTREGTEDTKNDIMLFSIVEAESHEAAAALFEDHPHLDIPQASIEIMPANPMQGSEYDWTYPR
jgi:hypothetical protein